MKRVFIADPALKTYQGHHYSVTLAFALSLKSAGYDVTIMANSNFSIKKDIALPFSIRPVFAVDTYDIHKVGRGPAVSSSQCPPKISILSRVKQKVRSLIYKSKPLLRPFYMGVMSEDQLLKTKLLIKQRILGKPVERILNHKLNVNHPVSDCPYDSLLAAFRKCKITVDDFVFFHTADGSTYQDVLDLFFRDTPIALWETRPRLLLSTPYDEVVMPHNKYPNTADVSVRRLEKFGLLNSKVFLFAENTLLAYHLTDYFNAAVDTLYVPFEVPSNHNVFKQKKISTFTYLGAARSEKGFVRVAEAVGLFLAEDSRDDVQFIIQASPQILGYTPDIEAAVGKLKSINDVRLKLIFTSQTPDEYAKCLVDTDCFFICYDYDRYKYRSSGIVVEALVNAKNAIVTEGTFPSYLLGTAGLIADSKKDIVAAIKVFIDQRDLLEKKAVERRGWFISECGPSDLPNKIKQVVSIAAMDIGDQKNHGDNDCLQLNYKQLI